ncbi:DUF2778 domain-containing protein [uncultured Roseibium sp.]|uniref:DUF2778 domain-containing protein n=1 Tax=uncultured Roseibium sp. TaxID=1936171 RepID=UPI002604D7F4|nr:DUF2778 domain-containing protein [uncultured Roseibium sp.]
MRLKTPAKSLKKRARTFKEERSFAVLIAVLAIGLAGAAASLTLFGQKETPSHHSLSVDDQRHLKLAHSMNERQTHPVAVTNGISTSSTPGGPKTAEPAPRSSTSSPSATPDAHDVFQKAARAHSHAQARSVARIKLTAKLTHLRFARYIDTARKENAAPRQLAAGNAAARGAAPSVPSPLDDATLEVAALGEATALEADRQSDPDIAASLPGDTPLDNEITGSIPRNETLSTPIPGTKPDIPVRTAAVAQERNSAPVRSAQPVLAYATPGNPEEEKNGAFNGIGKLFSGLKGGLPGRGSGIAVYDISAATVHMPDGTKLEAHSGIGHRKDNPKYSHVRNLGPTPPNIYDLRMRERRFHGVEAVRMLPRDLAAMKGRDGMLAHSPLLRRTNGSHGCVAFKDYNKFLKAFKAGKVKKIIVVPSMDKLPKYMAALNRSTGT